MEGLPLAMVTWHSMHLFATRNVISLPGSGLVWQFLHSRPNARCFLWLYGMGWWGAGCSAGLLGTICLAAGGAACCAVSRSAKQRSVASIDRAANSTTFLVFILDSSSKPESPHNRWLSGFLADHLFDARAEILEHHDRGIASRRTGHGTSRMGGSACLIKTRNWHAILRPSRHGTHRRGLRGALRT